MRDIFDGISRALLAVLLIDTLEHFIGVITWSAVEGSLKENQQLSLLFLLA